LKHVLNLAENVEECTLTL